MRATTTLSLLTSVGLALAAQAHAHVYIGLQQAGVNGGAITQEADDPVFASWAGQYSPVFNIQAVSGTSLGGLFDSASLNVLGTAPADLSVFVTETDAADAPAGFLSGLTSNVLPAGWTVDLSTWIDPANGIFTLVDQIGSASFAAIGTDTDISALTGTNPYSITGLYQIHSSGHSLDAASSTIHVETVREPASLALLGAGLFGAGIALRRRPKTAALA